ncbi:MAG: ribulose-phosphate 3-epimerase [Bacilli bacterium]|nr:ribulose-phosphate 3-epimerase [Bacilli bacterium]
MLISGSLLKICDDKEKIDELNRCCDMIHFDVMDGEFTDDKTDYFKNVSGVTKPIDVHLMVYDVEKYLDEVSVFKPEYVTFHYEIGNILSNINLIKNRGFKVGIAINPETEVSDIFEYLNLIDLVLVMSVPPGKGGQKFIDVSDKIDKLVDYRSENGLDYLIEVDGGINSETIKKVKNVDIAVCGSYITDSLDYEKMVKSL